MPDSIAVRKGAGKGRRPGLIFRFFPGKISRNSQNQYTKWFDYDKIKDTLSVRNRQTGDYITLASGRQEVGKILYD